MWLVWCACEAEILIYLQQGGILCWYVDTHMISYTHNAGKVWV